MNDAPSNEWPTNQAALNWLREGKASPEPWMSYMAQLAWWGLEKGVAEVPDPISPEQPTREDVQMAVDRLLGSGAQQAEAASRWFLSNPNLEFEEQADNLLRELEAAGDPTDAARVMVETAYNRMVAESE